MSTAPGVTETARPDAGPEFLDSPDDGREVWFSAPASG